MEGTNLSRGSKRNRSFDKDKGNVLVHAEMGRGGKYFVKGRMFW